MAGSNDNIFMQIINREIPAEIVYENDTVLAFKDIEPKAPIHILIVPKRCIQDVSSCQDDDGHVLGQLILAARDLAKKFEIKEGLRLVINEGKDGGQTVAHLHVHLLAGRSFDWPPG
ncbi:MAG: histidine triad nucleotide-binding protein [SAR324 cluster bacterium]|uniref:Histidine triad nucleotide-binding protein n=1 Tax=SAR324 cluster bacterium TaxID=2024889 RepID=A0A7X9FRT1_9DELT|nr:histidine triad nucleotide-binding protein [SAR324 cluster bacterium]